MDGTKDDPNKRKPDISLAKKELGWEPTVAVKDVSPFFVACSSRSCGDFETVVAVSAMIFFRRQATSYHDNYVPRCVLSVLRSGPVPADSWQLDTVLGGTLHRMWPQR